MSIVIFILFFNNSLHQNFVYILVALVFNSLALMEASDLSMISSNIDTLVTLLT